MSFLVSETRGGEPVLNGRRQIVGDVVEAHEVAAEMDGTAYAIEPADVPNPFPPVKVTELRDMGWLGEVH